MEMMIDFPGGSRVDAHFGSFTVATDQQPAASAPGPFDLFLASLATCSGFFVQSFCQTRKIQTNDITIMQTSERDPETHLVSKIQIEIRLPASFPEKYRSSVSAAANQCTVKKHLQSPPQIEVITNII